MRSLPLLLAGALALAACDSDDVVDPGDDAQRFRVEIENVAPAFGVLKSGVFNTPVGAAMPGPIGPGGAYEFSFTAGTNVTPGSGMRLSLATMFIQSNDLFYTFPAEGLALYDASGAARTGDVTAEILLYDAGTEVNQEPGTGADQAPRQSGPDTGADEGGTLGRIDDGEAGRGGFSYPDATDVIRVTVAHDGDVAFTVRIENVSDASTLALPGGGSDAVPLSPGGWAVHTDAVSFFPSGEAAPEWVEAIAEDGDPAPFAATFEPLTGVTVPLSPGVAVVHTDAVSFFTSGEAASAGIEGIAEDGDPSAAVAGLAGAAGVQSAEAFNTPAGASAPSPIGPGGSYSFEVDAEPGDRLAFATMFIQSNDLFYTFTGDGLALFTAAGAPVSGDVTGSVLLYDAGTEVNQEPGVGPDQAPRQSGPDVGPAEDGVLGRISDGTPGRGGFAYPDAADVIRVTVTPVDG
jgi:hypothetical protein